MERAEKDCWYGNVKMMLILASLEVNTNSNSTGVSLGVETTTFSLWKVWKQNSKLTNFLFISPTLVAFSSPAQGCLNGKGQAQTEDGKPDKALLNQMEEVYAAIPVRLPETNTHVQKMYQDWLEGMESKKVQEALHTKYSAVNETTSNLDIKW